VPVAPYNQFEGAMPDFLRRVCLRFFIGSACAEDRLWPAWIFRSGFFAFRLPQIAPREIVARVSKNFDLIGTGSAAPDGAVSPLLPEGDT
jgi:hypothetical protein